MLTTPFVRTFTGIAFLLLMAGALFAQTSSDKVWTAIEESQIGELVH